jgi:hypothetical protein
MPLVLSLSKDASRCFPDLAAPAPFNSLKTRVSASIAATKMIALGWIGEVMGLVYPPLGMKRCCALGRGACGRKWPASTSSALWDLETTTDGRATSLGSYIASADLECESKGVGHF